MEYRKKPVVINAFKFDGIVDCLRKNVDKKDWGKFIFVSLDPSGMVHQAKLNSVFSFQLQDYAIRFFIETLEGQHNLLEGDYVVKGVKGEYYPVKPDIFKETYEKADDWPKDVQPVLLTKIERDYMEAVLDEFLNDGGVQHETTVHDLLNDESKDKVRVREFGWRLRKKLGDVDRE